MCEIQTLMPTCNIYGYDEYCGFWLIVVSQTYKKNLQKTYTPSLNKVYLVIIIKIKDDNNDISHGIIIDK